MKRLPSLNLLSFFLLIFTVGLHAQERSMRELQEAARTHFATRSSERSDTPLFLSEENDLKLIGSSSTLLPDVKKESFYIFGMGERQFVILSADQRMPEILGYSCENSLYPEEIPQGLQAMLASYQQYADHLYAQPFQIQEKTTPADVSLPQEIKPLLNGISWSQQYPFYNECPYQGGTRTLVGCVATAMSTIMAYYKYPDRGNGTVSYTWKGSTMSKDFSSQFYQWDKIRNSYPYIRYSSSTQDLFSPEESHEVAQLCYDVALSIQTDFGTQTSSSYNTVKLGLQSFINHFSYDPNVQVLYRNYFSRNEWLSILQHEIAAGRPVLYRGGETVLSGHVFVADGYDKDGLIHFDFGWAGLANGYYHIAAISPDDLGPGTTGGYGFNIDQFMFIGLQPPTIHSSYQSHIIFNKALTLSKMTLDRTDRFSIETIFLNKGTAFKGSYCAVLVDENGKSFEISTPFSASLNMDASGTFKLNDCQIPKEITDGVYQLQVLVKDNAEKEWCAVRSAPSIPSFYSVLIEENQVQFSPASTDITLKEGTVTPTHNLYQNLPGEFTLTVSNGENEFLGTIGIGALDGLYYTVLADCIGSVQSGETLSYTLTGFVNLEPGDYTLIPLYKKGGTWIPLQMEGERITVRETPESQENLICKDAVFLQDSSEIPRDGVLEGAFTWTNEGAPYAYGIIYAFFHDVSGSSYNISTHYTPLFVDAKETVIQKVQFPHNLPEGNYIVQLYKLDALGNTIRLTPTEKTRFAFSVVPDSFISTLPPVGSEQEDFSLENDEQGITLRSSIPFSRVLLYDNSGNLISNVSTHTEKIYRIPVHTVNKGMYLLKVQLVNGSWLPTKKFRMQ